MFLNVVKAQVYSIKQKCDFKRIEWKEEIRTYIKFLKDHCLNLDSNLNFHNSF